MPTSASAECLIHLLNFEKYWAYSSQSYGLAYSEECKQAAIAFVVSFDRLWETTPEFKDSFGRDEDNEPIDPIARLRYWGDLEVEDPDFIDHLVRGLFMPECSAVKKTILSGNNILSPQLVTLANPEPEYTQDIARWKPHLIPKVLLNNPRQMLENASQSDTIAVYGDIRRSQDLMTYASNPNDFARNIVDFIDGTREIIIRHSGFFDKFTGDGFLAYFNSDLCRVNNDNYIDCFLRFVAEETIFAKGQFRNWTRTIRKLPEEEIGLAMGADIGKVEFRDERQHLVAVGDAVVWAARMAAVAKANETVVNNLLHSAIDENGALKFEPFVESTKAGEKFTAYRMQPLAVEEANE